MKKEEAIKCLKKVSKLKEELENILMDLEQSFLHGTYLYKGINIFVNEIDFDTGHVIIESCDESKVFLGMTDSITSITTKEFVEACLNDW